MNCKMQDLSGCGRAHGPVVEREQRAGEGEPVERTRRGPLGRVTTNGFTLMELLIVMAIIAILMLIAIPTVGALKKQADELSAKKSIQTIEQAEMMYEQTFPTNGFTCTLSALGGDPSSGAPSATSAQLIPTDLAGGFKQGYIFSLSNCTKVTVNGTDRLTGYTINAVPQTVGRTGDRGFCSDQFGTIKVDPAGGTNCVQPLQ